MKEKEKRLRKETRIFRRSGEVKKRVIKKSERKKKEKKTKDENLSNIH